MNLKQLVVMSAVAVATGCTSSQQHTSTPFDEYPVYEGEWVEMAYTPASTRFSLWAPSAQEVRVLLYEKGQGGSAYRMVKMEPASDGLWQARVDEDLYLQCQDRRCMAGRYARTHGKGCGGERRPGGRYRLERD